MDQLLLAAIDKRDLAAAEKLKQTRERVHTLERGARGETRAILYYEALFDLKSGRATEAIANFKEALKHRAVVWTIDVYGYCLANAYLEQNRLDDAIAEYERTLRLNPNYPLVHYHLAQAYRRKGQQRQAHAAYERFLQVWKDADRDIPERLAAEKRLGSPHNPDRTNRLLIDRRTSAQ